MGTFLKYVIYALIIVAIYFLGVGFYEGTLNKDSSISEMSEHVTSNTKEMVGEGYQKTKDAIQGGINEIVVETEDKIENDAQTVESQTKEVMKGGFKQ